MFWNIRLPLFLESLTFGVKLGKLPRCSVLLGQPVIFPFKQHLPRQQRHHASAPVRGEAFQFLVSILAKRLTIGKQRRLRKVPGDRILQELQSLVVRGSV